MKIQYNLVSSEEKIVDLDKIMAYFELQMTFSNRS